MPTSSLEDFINLTKEHLNVYIHSSKLTEPQTMASLLCVSKINNKFQHLQFSSSDYMYPFLKCFYYTEV